MYSISDFVNSSDLTPISRREYQSLGVVNTFIHSRSFEDGSSFGVARNGMRFYFDKDNNIFSIRRLTEEELKEFKDEIRKKSEFVKKALKNGEEIDFSNISNLSQFNVFKK